MPVYNLSEDNLDFNNKSVIVDTNVLVSAFLHNEPNHEDARFFLDEYPYQLLIPMAVVVETWGFLVGARRQWIAGYEFLAWLNTPGKAALLVPQQGTIDMERELINELQIDCVDAIIANLAQNITKQCSLSSSLPIATYDTRDFYRLSSRLHLDIFDMNSDISQYF